MPPLGSDFFGQEEPWWFDPNAGQDYFTSGYPIRIAPQGRPEVKREALRELIPETQSPISRLLRGGWRDIRDLAGGIGALVGLALSPLYGDLTPYEKVYRALPQLGSEPPEESFRKAKAIFKFFWEPLKESYTPRESESIAEMLTRRALDHPLATLMDVSLVAQAGAGAITAGARRAALGSVARAARTVGEAARSLDPITLARNITGKAIAYTPLPGWAAKSKRQLSLAQQWLNINAEHRAAAQAVNIEIEKVVGSLDPQNRALLFPLIEGRISLLPGQPGAAELTEAVNYIIGLRNEWQRSLGMLPEDIAQQAADTAYAKAVKAGVTDVDELRTVSDNAYKEAFNAALEDQAIRNTVSTRTLIDEQRMAEYERKVMELKLAGEELTEDEIARRLPPPPPATPQEAFEMMAHTFEPAPPAKISFAGQGPSEYTSGTADLWDITAGEHTLRVARPVRRPGLVYFDLTSAPPSEEGLKKAFMGLREFLQQNPGTVTVRAEVPDEKLGSLIRKHFEGAAASSPSNISIPTESVIKSKFAQPEPAAPTGAYFPHSGEVLTRDVLTVGNILTKVRESLPWRNNEGALFRTGNLADLDPVKALQQTNRAIEFRGVFREFLEKFGQERGVKLPRRYSVGTDPELRAGTHQLLHPNGKLQMYTLANEAQRLWDLLAEHADDPAVRDLNFAEQVEKMVAKMGKTIAVKRGPMYKIPKEAGDELAEFIAAMTPPKSSLIRHFDRIGDIWRFTTLNLRPMWVLNNIIGNTVFSTMYGVSPVDYYLAARNFARLRRMPGVGGGLYQAEAASNAERYLYAPERGTGVQRIVSRVLGETAGKVAAKAVTGGARALGHLGGGISDVNAAVEDFFRSAAYVHGIRKADKYALKSAAGAALKIESFATKLAELEAMGRSIVGNAEHRRAVELVNRFLNDYTQQTPFARRYLRRIIPFQSFYRHSAELLLRYPFEYPGRALLMRRLGKAAQDDLQDTLELWGFDWYSDVPEWLKNAIPIKKMTSPNGEEYFTMLNTRGPNPFSVLETAGQEALGLSALHPILKVALEEMFGINLFTMQPFTAPLTTFTGQTLDPETGRLERSQATPSLLDNLLRQFWPAAMARQVLARGRVPFDTTSLLEQLRGKSGIYRTNIRGQEVRRPAPLWPLEAALRPFGQTPSYLEHPTREQFAAVKREYSALLNRLARQYPELRGRILEVLMEKARTVPPRHRLFRRS